MKKINETEQKNLTTNVTTNNEISAPETFVPVKSGVKAGRGRIVNSPA